MMITHDIRGYGTCFIRFKIKIYLFKEKTIFVQDVKKPKLSFCRK